MVQAAHRAARQSSAGATAHTPRHGRSMTVHGILEFTRRIDGDPLIVLPETLRADEIRVCFEDDLAKPIPARLLPRIKVRTRKLTDYAFRWLVDDERPKLD